MIDEEFEKLVSEAIDALPSWVHAKLENVAFLVLDEPTQGQRRKNKLQRNETLFGLYEGVPLSERGNDAIEYPDTITIFKNPILASYASIDDIRACIHNTVWHEVAHYFGHDEEWVAREEKKRGRTH